MADKITAADVKELRRRHGWTQQELAARIHVAVSTVARWETEKQKPNNAMTHALRALDKKR